MSALLTKAGDPPGVVVKSDPSVSFVQLDPWSTPDARPLPEALAPWLREMGSLTLRLRAHAPGFALELLGYRELMFDATIAPLLGESHGLCREVVLHAGGRPCVYGWTLLPARGMACATLGNQGETPLGELVFRHREAQRHLLEVARFAVERSRWSPAATLWGRRSLLALDGVPLLVHELFLPGLFDAKESV